MTASSEWDPDHGPKYARLHNTAGAGAWCPTAADRDALPRNVYIQVSTKVEMHVYVHIMQYFCIHAYIVRKFHLCTDSTLERTLKCAH